MKTTVAKLRRAVQRAQSRPMPALQSDFRLRRWAWWATALTIGGFAVLFTVAVFVDDWEWEQATWVFSGLALAWWTMLYFLIAVILRRRRHTAHSLSAAALDRAAVSVPSPATDPEYHGPPNDTGVYLPGSARISRALACVAGGWTVAFAFFAVAAESGWRVTWAVFAAFFAFSVVSSMFAIRPRWVLLTPEWIYVAASRGSAQLRWDDVDAISYIQSYDGMMIYRLTAKEGVSTQVTRRHPFTRARNRSLDIEFATLDLDPLLVALAIEIYCLQPQARAEIAGPMPPARLTDPVKALEDVWLPAHSAGFRPESPGRTPR